MNEQIMEVSVFLEENKAQMASWEQACFGSFICMAMEEYCRAHEMDVVEMAADLAKMVAEVNELMGKYEYRREE